MLTYEIPTHLHVADRVLAGLTWHQLFLLGGGGAGAFWLWGHAPLPVGPHVVLAAVPVLVGLACALVRPDGYPLLTWLGLVATYVATPRRVVWHRAVAVELQTPFPRTTGAADAVLPAMMAHGGRGNRPARSVHAAGPAAAAHPAAYGFWQRALAPLLAGRVLCLSTHHQRTAHEQSVA
jgi:hypothetical protein